MHEAFDERAQIAYERPHQESKSYGCSKRVEYLRSALCHRRLGKDTIRWWNLSWQAHISERLPAEASECNNAN